VHEGLQALITEGLIATCGACSAEIRLRGTGPRNRQSTEVRKVGRRALYKNVIQRDLFGWNPFLTAKFVQQEVPSQIMSRR
jgi:hypothetical protein